MLHAVAGTDDCAGSDAERIACANRLAKRFAVAGCVDVAVAECIGIAERIGIAVRDAELGNLAVGLTVTRSDESPAPPQALGRAFAPALTTRRKRKEPRLREALIRFSTSSLELEA